MTSLFYTQRHLIPLQVVMFFFFSATVCLTPFLSLHMRDLGLDHQQAAIASAVAAWVSACAPAISGMLAERYGRYRVMLTLTLLMSGICATALLFVPRVVRITRNPVLEFDCSPAVKVEKCENWNSCGDSRLATDNKTMFELYHCKYQCRGAVTSNNPYPLHVCFKADDDSNMCMVYDPYDHDNDSVEFESRLASWFYEVETSVESLNFLTYDPDRTPDLINVCVYKPMAPIVVNKQPYKDLSCRPMPEGCSIKCMIHVYEDNNIIKPPPCVEVRGDPNLTFLSYLVVRIFLDVFLLSSHCLLDALTLKNINDFYGTYAKTRIWPAIGMAIFAPVSGILIDYYTSVSNKADYSPAIFVFDGLILIASALVIAMSLQPKAKFRNYFPAPMRTRKPKFWTFEITTLLILVILLGSLWGFMETYLYTLYIDIGATKKLIGFSITLTLVCSFPFLLLTKNLVRNIGRGHLLIFAFYFYAIRYAGISYIHNPWWIMPFEAMSTFSLIILWVSLVAYIQSLAPKSWRLRAQYLLNALHFGVGRGLGSLGGGLASEEWGLRPTFRGTAVAAAVLGLLFLPIYHLVVKRTRLPPCRHYRYPSGVVLNDGWHQAPAVADDDVRPNGAASNHIAAQDPSDDEDN